MTVETAWCGMDDSAAYRAQCRRWLSDRVAVLPSDNGEWGSGCDDVSVFHSLSADDERALIEKASAWQAEKLAAGYGAITWPVEFGGSGLSPEHEWIFRAEEAAFDTPRSHELLRITVNLAAPTVRELGSVEQQELFIPLFLSSEELACQLFSEPGAGSDLASVATRAVADGREWILNGSKVWTSGAQYASWGLLLARTDPDVPKHAGMTAFLLPMRSDGVDVRPIRQMSGGSSFSEVFLSDVRVADSLRLGAVGDGWRVALVILGFERGQSGSKRGVGGSWEQLRALASWAQKTDDPALRQRLLRVYSHERVREWTRLRGEAARRSGSRAGPEGSVGKLLWTRGLTAIGELAAEILGPRILADTGEWGAFAWSQHVLGAPGYRLAGGSDEIQRNIIAERTLGLPPEPRRDAGRP